MKTSAKRVVESHHPPTLMIVLRNCLVSAALLLSAVSSPAASAVPQGPVASRSAPLQVLCIEEGAYPSAILIGKDKGLSVFVQESLLPQLRPGDLIEPEFTTNPFNDLLLKSFRVCGAAPLPAPLEADVGSLPKLQCRPVTLSGVVRSVRKDNTNHAWTWMTLRTPSGDFPVAAQKRHFSFERLRDLIDAEVKLTGYVKPMVTWRSGMGLCLYLVDGYRQETLLAPSNDFDSHAPFLRNPGAHRQRLAGTVIAVAHGSFFVLADHDSILCCEVQPVDGNVHVEIGDSITTIGFFTPSVNDYIVSEARVRVDGKNRPFESRAVDIGFDDLYKTVAGDETISTKFHQRRIRLTGMVKGLFDSPNGRKTLILGNANRTIQVDVSAFADERLSAIRPDCILQATGLCLADFSTTVTGARPFEFSSFSLLPATADDLKVLSTPSRPNTGLLLAIIGLLLATLVGATVWNRSLATLSERRGEMLSKEKIAVSEARLKVEERTRLAVELHDALSQNLTGTALQLDAVRRFADTDRIRMSHHLEIAARMLKSCRTELRNCLWDLRNRTLEELDMNTAINRTVSPFIGEARLIIRFNVPRTSISDNAAHTLMRIIRELSANAVRHGHATVVRIAGALENGRLLFSVCDNGSGFDLENHPGPREGHFGLEGIQERVSRLDGQVRIASTRQGTSITISIRA